MIHAYLGATFIIGLTRPNFETLLLGRALRVALLPRPWWDIFHPRLRTIVILFGEDRPAVLRQLAHAGLDIPPDVWALVEAQP